MELSFVAEFHSPLCLIKFSIILSACHFTGCLSSALMTYRFCLIYVPKHVLRMI